MKLIQISLVELSALSVLATVRLSTSDLQCQRIRELARSLQATLIGSHPPRTIAPFLFPYSVLYHYRRVPGKDNDMYIYSTWATRLAGSHRADNPLLSLLKLSLSPSFIFIPLSASEDTGHLLFVP